MSGFEDRQWPRASAWLKQGSPRPKLGVLGIPLNASISPGRCDLAPAAIRAALHRFSTYDCEHGVDLSQVAVCDFGDSDVASLNPIDAFQIAGVQVDHASQDADKVVLLGGDNSITRIGVHGMGLPLDRVGVVTLDAHLDMRSLDLGLINGNPIRALLDDGVQGSNIFQVGIHAFANSEEYWRDALEAGNTLVTMSEVRRRGVREVLQDAFGALAAKVDAIYFDLDLDVLDRGFCPGCPGSRPGGLQPSDLLEAAYLAGSHPKVLIMDLVELDPERDINDVTAMTAAACLLNFASGCAAL